VQIARKKPNVWHKFEKKELVVPPSRAPTRSDPNRFARYVELSRFLERYKSYLTNTPIKFFHQGSGRTGTGLALALAMPSSRRSRPRLVSNSVKTPSMLRKHLPAAVLVPIDCSFASSEALRVSETR
jgi:hypothetical protein